MKRLSLVCLAALLILLTGCGVMAETPPKQAIQLALSQRLENTQASLALGLGLSDELGRTPNFKINQLTVQSREKLTGEAFENRAPGDVYRVRGTFSTTLTISNPSKHANSFQQSSPFEIYLGSSPQDANSDVETWFVIKPTS